MDFSDSLLAHDARNRGWAEVRKRSTHVADEARRRHLSNATETVELDTIVNRYGVGVDCQSRFFQICALARCGDAVPPQDDAAESNS